jgi:omega-amidase
MQDLKIAFLQFDQVWENRLANWEKIDSFLTSLKPVDLLILPEMFDTGFSMNITLAEEWGVDNPSFCFLRKISAQYHVAIYTSCMVKHEGVYYNRGIFIEPNGTTKIYDKRKSFGLGGEDRYFTPGNSETIANYLGWNLNLQICYDLRFPELIRNRIINEKAAYDVLIYVANWPEKRVEHWKALLKARAIENQCYVIGVNRIGEDANKLKYSGDSLIYDALGKEISTANSLEGIVYSSLNFSELESIRNSLPFLKDR